jgi:EAL domain-containing protein (putative c-di-GMP-specific phosphodiesterase class I)
LVTAPIDRKIAFVAAHATKLGNTQLNGPIRYCDDPAVYLDDALTQHDSKVAMPIARRNQVTLMTILFVVTGVVAIVSNDRVALLVLPLAHLVQSALLYRNIKVQTRTPPASHIRDAYLGLAITCIPASALQAYGRIHHLPSMRTIGLAFSFIALLFAMTGGGLTAGPMFRAPSLTTSLSLLLTGFVFGGVAMQWATAVPDSNVPLIGTLKAVAGLGVGLVIASAVPLIRRSRTLGRRNETWGICAVVLWTLGQFALAFRGSHATMGLIGAPAVVGVGLITAAMWAPGASELGRPLTALQSDRSTRTATTVMLTVVSASVALLVPYKVGWGSGASISVSTIAIAQAAVIAWFITNARHGDHFTPATRARAHLRRDLRAALIRGEIEPHYQPIYRASDEQPAGFECLARWRHAELGVLTAADFLDVARQDDLLDTIDRLMFASTLEHLDTLLGCLRTENPFVTVNVHPERFASTSFVEEIGIELTRRGRTGAGLIVELTEHTSIENWDQFAANAAALQALGIGIAVDDFGMGNANYGLLLQCEPNIIKFDKVITNTSVSTARGRALLQSAFDAATAVGAQIVVEGIEDKARAPQLVALGAHYFQGYAFGRAASLATLSSTALA